MVSSDGTNGEKMWLGKARRLASVVVSEIGRGVGDEALIRSAVASEVKKRRGSAAIQVTNNSSFGGIIHAAPGFYMATGVRRMQFAIVKYVEGE